MQSECILAPQKQRQKVEIEVVEKQKLGNLLTNEQMGDLRGGQLVATLSATGQKLNLDDEVSGTVLLLGPLCGG